MQRCLGEAAQRSEVIIDLLTEKYSDVDALARFHGEHGEKAHVERELYFQKTPVRKMPNFIASHPKVLVCGITGTTH